MARSDEKYIKAREEKKKKLKTRSLAGFYYFAKEFISRKAKCEKHLCETYSEPYKLLQGTPILDSPKINQLSLTVAEMYPSDTEYGSVNDEDDKSDAEEEDKSDDDEEEEEEESDDDDDDEDKSDNDDEEPKVIDPVNFATNKEIDDIELLEKYGFNPEDKEESDNEEVYDVNNEYGVKNTKVSVTSISKINKQPIRTKEYLKKYNVYDTWVDNFL